MPRRRRRESTQAAWLWRKGGGAVGDFRRPLRRIARCGSRRLVRERFHRVIPETAEVRSPVVVALLAARLRGHLDESCPRRRIGGVRGAGAMTGLALHAPVEHLAAVEHPVSRTGDVTADAFLLLLAAAETIERRRVLGLRPGVIDCLVAAPATVGPGVARGLRRRRILGKCGSR